MMDVAFVLSRDQRHDILKAVEAIGRQLNEVIARQPDKHTLYVISTNLAIIQTSLTNLPRVNSN